MSNSNDDLVSDLEAASEEQNEAGGIEGYEFTDMLTVTATVEGGRVSFDDGNKCHSLNKSDAIELAKHFKLNAREIECTEHVALQEYYAQIEEDNFDREANLRAEVALLNQKLTMKRAN